MISGILLLVINNGLLICYGKNTNTGVQTITLPTAYIQSYSIQLTYESAGTPLVTCFYRTVTLSSFVIAYRSYSNEPARQSISWFTVGY